MVRFFYSHTIRTRLFKALILGIGAVLGVAAVAWQVKIEPALRVATAVSQRETARRAADEINGFLEQRIFELSEAAEVGGLWDEAPERRKEILYRLLKFSPTIAEISLTDHTGMERLRLSRTRRYASGDLVSLTEQEKFRETIQGRVYVGRVYHADTQEPFISLAVPIKFTSADIRGVLSAEISLKTLWDSIAHIKVGTFGHGFVVDGAGRLIAHPDYSKVLLGSTMTHLHEVREFLERGDNDSDPGAIQIGERGNNVITSFAVVPRPNWAIVLEEPVETALAQVRETQIFALLLVLAAVLVAFGFSYSFSARIAAAVRALEHGAKLIAQGDVDQRLEIHTGDEIETLAQQFNCMAVALKELHQDLERKITERTRDLSSLYAALTPLAPKRPDRLLHDVVDRLKEATGADAALIRTYDHEAKAFVYPAHVGFPENYLEATRRLDGDSAIGRAFLTGQPIVAADISQDARIKAKRQLQAGLKSCAFLPLHVAGEVRGVIHLASREIGHFTPGKTDHLMAIARQMGMSMENQELFAEIRQRAQQQEALNAIARATNQSLDLHEIFDIALDKTVEVTGRQRVNIRLKDALTGKIELVSHRGFLQDEIDQLRQWTLHPLTQQVFASGKPQIVNGDEASAPSRLLQRTRSAAWIPIKAKEKVVGVLGISDHQSKPFSQSEVKLLDAIGSVIGVAIENARLFQSIQHALERVRALREIDKAITSTLDLHAVLDVLMEKIDLVLPYAATTVTLFNKSSGSLEPIACRNLNEREWKRDQAGRGILNTVFETRAPCSVSDVNSHPSAGDSEFFRRHGLVSYLGVPLTVKEDVLGILGFYTRERHEFSAEEVEFLATLAGQAAIAIHNSQLFHEVKDAETSLARKVDELRRSNAELEQFAYVASHDLQEPLRMVSGYTQLLSRRYKDKLGPDAAEYIGFAVDGAKRMHDLINDLLTYSRVTYGMEFAAADCDAMLKRVMSDLELAISESGAVITHDALPTVWADVSQVQQVFRNLIGNAIKFRNCEPPQIHVSCQKQNDAWLFSVTDNGIGIDRQYMEKIFVIFQRLHSPDRYPGTGIGLAICKKIVERHGGRIWAESELNKGTTFFFTLPGANHGTEWTGL